MGNLRKLPVTGIHFVITSSYEPFLICQICTNKKTIEITDFELNFIHKLWWNLHKNLMQNRVFVYPRISSKFNIKDCDSVYI